MSRKNVAKSQRPTDAKFGRRARAVVLLCGRAAERLLIANAGLGAGGDDESHLAQVTRFVATLHASCNQVGQGPSASRFTVGRARIISNSKDYGPWPPKQRRRGNISIDPHYVIEI